MRGVETSNPARGKIVRTASRLNKRHAGGCKLPALILMTDDERSADWLGAVRALPRGSAVIVRHRDGREREKLARQLRRACAERQIKLLIADDARLAVRVPADGVHVPERRIRCVGALKARHPRWFVSASVHGARSLANASPADAVLIAPAFATASHPERAALGVVRLAALATNARAPSFALGGVDEGSIQRLSAVPLCGVALIGGWVRRNR